MSKKRVLLVSPTMKEIKEIIDCKDFEIVISGIGMVNCAVESAKAVDRIKPNVVILAGIAGAYPDKGLNVGDIVGVIREYNADLGVFYPAGFRSICDLNISGEDNINYTDIKDTKLYGNLKLVNSNSVNAAVCDYVDVSNAQIENMEGYGFFKSMEAKEVEYLQIRAISNIVSKDRSSWNMELAIKRLNSFIIKFIEEL